jgi:hypothetical protein
MRPQPVKGAIEGVVVVAVPYVLNFARCPVLPEKVHQTILLLEIHQPGYVKESKRWQVRAWKGGEFVKTRVCLSCRIYGEREEW